MEKNSKKRNQKIAVIISEVLMVISCAIVVVLFLTLGVGASLEIGLLSTTIGYASVFSSLLLLVIPLIKKLNSFFRKYKSFGFVMGITTSIMYACFRINYFPNWFQFEHLLTTLIIIASYFVWVLKKE